MRIEFAPGPREPVSWTGGTLHIGSAADNDVQLDGGGVAMRHVRLTGDRRGLVLDVESGAGRVYVNARPVRERALLRLGDTLGIGHCRLRLCADDVVSDGVVDDQADIADVKVMPASSDATLALRAVAGPLSGRVWPLSGRLELDAQGPASVSRDGAMVLVADGHSVHMDATAVDDTALIRVNGVVTRRARLDDGDQLVMGAHHFVLEVSARAQPVRPATESPDVSQAVEPARVRVWHRETGWLIATAVLLALVLAWVLLAHG